jgi:DNA repair protein RadC
MNRGKGISTFTKRIAEGEACTSYSRGKLLDITLLDIILSSESYVSMADEGLI